MNGLAPALLALVLAAPGTARAGDLTIHGVIADGGSIAPGAVIELGLMQDDHGVARPLASPTWRASGGEVIALPSPDRYVARALVRAGPRGELVVEATSGDARATRRLVISDAILTDLRAALSVSVEPAVIVKRGDGPQRATVTVRAPPGAAPIVSSTVGALDSLEAVAPGVWRAVLTPGDAPWPELAIVSATLPWPDARSPTAAVAHALLPLSSAIVLPGETRPNVDISVQIGARTFGPVRSDERGRFTVPVIVPPGVRFGAGISKDKLGTRRATTIDLQVPPLSRIALTPASDATLVGGFGLALGVVALDRAGQPAADAPTLTASQGRVVDVRALGGGRYLARYLPPATPAVDTITARFADGSAASVTVDARAAAPAAVRALARPALVTAPSGERARVDVEVLDRAGVPVADARLSARAASGVVAIEGARTQTLQYAPASVRVGWDDPVDIAARAPAGRIGAQLAFDGASLVVLDAAARPVPRARLAWSGGAIEADGHGVLPLSPRDLPPAALAGQALPVAVIALQGDDGALHAYPVAESAARARVVITLADPAPVDVRATLQAGAVRYEVRGAAAGAARQVRITASDGAQVTVDGATGSAAPPGPLPLLVQDVESGVAAVVSAR